MTESNNPWWRWAACKGVDLDVFYPPPHPKQVDVDRAKGFCRECAVVDDCLAEAVELQDRDGIWGGTTPAERGMRRKDPRPSRPVRRLPVVPKKTRVAA